MSRSTRLNLSYEPYNTAQPDAIFNELIDWIEAGGTEFVRNSLAVGLTLLIPTGHQLIVSGEYDNQGTLDVEGDLVIL